MVHAIHAALNRNNNDGKKGKVTIKGSGSLYFCFLFIARAVDYIGCIVHCSEISETVRIHGVTATLKINNVSQQLTTTITSGAWGERRKWESSEKVTELRGWGDYMISSSMSGFFPLLSHCFL